MWSVFKFFFFWFWLGLLAFLIGAFLVGVAHPGTAHEMARVRHAGPPDFSAMLVLVVSFFMCVPAYFIARPKNG